MWPLVQNVFYVVIVSFSTLAHVRQFPINSSPPGHPVLCLLFSQLKLSHILYYTLVPCFTASASTFFTFNHHSSACILVLTFNMPKPSRSTTSNTHSISNRP